MDKKVYFIVFLWIVSCLPSFGQDMNLGFSFLESGKFNLAETFFQEILQQTPSNRTARLCYARAIGLNGQPKIALEYFEKLLIDYPNDFEIELNLAEALLWNKSYSKARVNYKKLLEINSSSFSAILGYANTLSSLQEYEEALLFVDKAILIQPNNKSVKISKKYIQLGYSSQLVIDNKFEKAIKLLENNLILFPHDNETILNLANVYIQLKKYDRALLFYDKLKENEKEIILRKLGYSLVHHLKKDEKQALVESNIALKLIQNIDDSLLIIAVYERYIQSLIWISDFNYAQLKIDELQLKYNNQNWLNNLQAMLFVYKQDFAKSIKYYKQVLKKDSSSFNGNLGLANAYFAMKKYRNAYSTGKQTLNFYKKQKDALFLLTKIENKFSPSIKSKVIYSFDSGSNNSIESDNQYEKPLTTTFLLIGGLGFRNTKNETLDNTIQIYKGNLGFGYRINNRVILKYNLRYSRVFELENEFNLLETNVHVKYNPFKLQEFTFSYINENENFNADLINRKIKKNSFGLQYNLSTTMGLGMYNQYVYSSQSDENTRHLLFSSLYYMLKTKSKIKLGLNAQYLSFSRQVPQIYFSPEYFKVFELFAELFKNDVLENKGWIYNIHSSIGYQFIEDQKKQVTYRMKGSFGYRISSKFKGQLYVQKSNIASGNTSGFSYTEFGVVLNWNLINQSIFRK